MTYEDLLVHLDHSKDCARHVDAAIGLAARHGAHLTGVYPVVEIPLLKSHAIGAVDLRVNRLLHSSARRRPAGATPAGCDPWVRSLALCLAPARASDR